MNCDNQNQLRIGVFAVLLMTSFTDLESARADEWDLRFEAVLPQREMDKRYFRVLN